MMFKIINRYRSLIAYCEENQVPKSYNRFKMYCDALIKRFIHGISIEEYVRNEYYSNPKNTIKEYYSRYDIHHSYLWVCCDLLLCRITQFVRADEYFRNEFFDLRWGVRGDFLTQGRKLKMMKICNSDAKVPEVDDKVRFDKNFAPLLKRTWIDMETASFEEFKAFAKSVPIGFLKYTDGLQGIGARKIEFDKMDLEALYNECSGKRVIVEELITQHHEIAAFNTSTVNTLRVVTFVRADGAIDILDASLRIGRSNQVADNFHMNGIAASIDIETGAISDKAVDARGIRYVCHPDSGKIIPGFLIPHWDLVKETVRKAAQTIPEVRYIGWDVAIRENDVCLVEGNSTACPDVLEMPVRRGIWKKLQPLVEEVKKTSGRK